MKTVCIHQASSLAGRGIRLTNPARIVVDGVDVTSRVTSLRVAKEASGDLALVTLTFLPEELLITGDFPVEEATDGNQED